MSTLVTDSSVEIETDVTPVTVKRSTWVADADFAAFRRDVLRHGGSILVSAPSRNGSHVTYQIDIP